jgi:4-amino-4-deoxy-L-arabinose transferase-like glycosyltransferase
MTTEDPTGTLRRYVIYALLLRLVVGVVITLADLDDVFAPDHQTYDFFASWLARYWSGDSIVYPWKLLDPGPKAYYYIVATLYWVFGRVEFLPKLLNMLVGASTIPLAYEVAFGLGVGSAAALRAALYTGFFPSLVLWSVLNVRDSWVVFLILLVCREAMRVSQKGSLRHLLGLLGGVVLLVQFRDYIFLPVAAPAALFFFVRKRANVGRNVLLGMLVAIAVIYTDQAFGNSKLQRIDFETLNEIRHGTAEGNSLFEPTADISTPGKALLFLPKGLAFFLLAPFPWQLTNVRQALTLPEMLFLYVLIPSIVAGIVHLARDRTRDALLVLLVSAGLTVGYSLGQANAGTAYRHRAQVLPFFLMFGAVGVELRRRRATAQGAAGLP